MMFWSWRKQKERLIQISEVDAAADERRELLDRCGAGFGSPVFLSGYEDTGQILVSLRELYAMADALSRRTGSGERE